MLGRFLEFSIVTPDIRASAWTHPYAVLTDGRICLGLHDASTPVPSITFINPDLLKFLDSVEDLGLTFAFRRLGTDVFNEIALPAPNRDAAKAYWERFGFVGIEEPDAVLPHVSCTSDSVDIGLYAPAQIPAPTLLFEVEDFRGALARLGAAGIEPTGQAAAGQSSTAMLVAPEGTPILLSAAPGA